MAAKVKTVPVGRRNDDDTVYVAVGRDVNESKATLLWALKNFPGETFTIVHVHRPSDVVPSGFNPFTAGKFPAIPTTKIGQFELRVHHELEIQLMHMMLDECLLFCQQAGMEAEKLYVEMDDIGEGIVKLVYQHNIKKLVMGAAANKDYSERMVHLKSKKALYVHERASHSCQIWFTCNGHLIIYRGNYSPGVESQSLNSSSPFESGLASLIRSIQLDSSYWSGVESPSLHSSSSIEGGQPSQKRSDFSRVVSLGRARETNGNSSGGEPELGALPPAAKGNNLPAHVSWAMEVAEKSSQDVRGESARHGKTEQTSDVETICRARALESLYTEELRRRKEVEEELAKEKQRSKARNEWDEELLILRSEKLALELQVTKLTQVEKELQDRVLSADEVSKAYKKELDDLLVERNNALRVTEELLRKQSDDSSSLNTSRFFTHFSFSEIQDATCDFDQSKKIGGYGNLYKGVLRHTSVIMKMLGPREFQQEVDLMRKLSHPNIVTLIGLCPAACVLVYEYLPNGSLRDRLSCTDNTPPLSWQTRVGIATELCSVLMFLHSSTPDPIVHGDLKPVNVLLGANFTSKLNNFGTCRTNSLHQNSGNITQSDLGTDSENTLSSLDPNFLETGELSPNSDVYSFGIILLQLLMGASFSDRLAVATVIEEGNLNSLLDPLAGDWPFVQANQLAHLALRCCSMNPNDRPDLASEAWRLLEPMRSCCGASQSIPLTPEERSNPPSHFICPIYQEVMENPCVAADGYTYEEEALKGWIESEHDTSPMTNLKLDHLNLVPNLALRSAIREWQERW